MLTSGMPTTSSSCPVPPPPSYAACIAQEQIRPVTSRDHRVTLPPRANDKNGTSVPLETPPYVLVGPCVIPCPDAFEQKRVLRELRKWLTDLLEAGQPVIPGPCPGEPRG
jgi:hypothetical protein